MDGYSMAQVGGWQWARDVPCPATGHVPSALCSSSRMQQHGYLSSPTLCRSSTTWLQAAAWIHFKTLVLAHCTSRTWSNHKPQSVHYALLLLPHYEGAQLLPNKITTVCCPGSTMVEQVHHWHQNIRNSTHLPFKTPLFRLHIGPKKKKKILNVASEAVQYIR